MTHSFPTRRSSDLVDVGAVVALLERRDALVLVNRAGVRSAVARRRYVPPLGWHFAPVPAELAADRLDGGHAGRGGDIDRSEEHTSELQSLMRISYAVFCLKKKIETQNKLIS